MKCKQKPIEMQVAVAFKVERPRDEKLCAARAWMRGDMGMMNIWGLSVKHYLFLSVYIQNENNDQRLLNNPEWMQDFETLVKTKGAAQTSMWATAIDKGLPSIYLVVTAEECVLVA